MKAQCIRDCFDGPKAILFRRGEVYDISPKKPYAKYFVDENGQPLVKEEPKEKEDKK